MPQPSLNGSSMASREGAQSLHEPVRVYKASRDVGIDLTLYNRVGRERERERVGGSSLLGGSKNLWKVLGGREGGEAREREESVVLVSAPSQAGVLAHGFRDPGKSSLSWTLFHVVARWHSQPITALAFCLPTLWQRVSINEVWKADPHSWNRKGCWETVSQSCCLFCERWLDGKYCTLIRRAQ